MKGAFRLLACSLLMTTLFAPMTVVSMAANDLPTLHQDWQHDPEVEHFVATTATKQHLDAKAIKAILQEAHLNPHIIALMRHPYEHKPWYQYRSFFLKEGRIRQGVRVWKQYRDMLERVTKATGVPPEIMLAIIGMESNYGQHMGAFKALDALATLAFAYPPRALYFRYELGELLALAKEQHLDLKQVKGSYAGALGMPQFMPSSYRRFARDMDGDHRVDLFHSAPDSFGSIGYFLKHFGWQRNHSIAEPVTHVHTLIGPSTRVGELFSPEHDRHHHALDRPWYVMMEGRHAPLLWRVHTNFRAIMHYNNSSAYAMAVTELAQAIRQRYDQRRHTT